MLELKISSPPYGISRRTLTGWIGQFAKLVQVMLAEYRATWVYHAIFGLFMPIGLIFFLKMTGLGASREQAVFLLGGQMALSIAWGPTMMMVGRVGWGRQNREFDYWAALPVSKLALVLAMVTVYLLFALPGLAGIYLLGSLMLGLPLAMVPAFIILVPLSALSLSGLGAFLGAYAKDGQTANVIGNMFMGVVAFLTPMMIPMEAMPAPLRVAAKAVPVTYVADAFRIALAGHWTSRMGTDILVIAAFTVAALVLVHVKLDWRNS